MPARALHFGLHLQSSRQLQPAHHPVPLGAAHRPLPLPPPVLAATLSDFDKAFEVLFFFCTCCTVCTPSSVSNLQHISQVGRGIYPSDRQRGEAKQRVQGMERVCKLTGTQPRPELVPQLLAHASCCGSSCRHEVESDLFCRLLNYMYRHRFLFSSLPWPVSFSPLHTAHLSPPTISFPDPNSASQQSLLPRAGSPASCLGFVQPLYISRSSSKA